MKKFRMKVFEDDVRIGDTFIPKEASFDDVMSATIVGKGTPIIPGGRESVSSFGPYADDENISLIHEFEGKKHTISIFP